MEVVKINPQDYGLTDETASNISSQFKPMLDKMVELENEYNEVVKMPLDDEETSKAARQLRLKYVKVRTGTLEIHKQQKAFFLNGGRFVDGWKNAQIFAAQGKEDNLQAIENHAENLEKQRKYKLHEQRFAELMPYIDAQAIDTTNFPNFGDMDDDVWDAYLTAKKKAFSDRAEAEAKALLERQRLEKELTLHNERRSQLMDYWQFVDADTRNANFGIWTEKYFKGFITTVQAAKQRYDQEQAELRKKAIEAQEQARKEAEARKAAEEGLRKAEIEKMALLKAQREKERQEAAMKAEAEAKAAEEEKARKAAERKAKNAPDKQKLEQFAKTLETLRDAMPAMKTEDGQGIATNVSTLMTKIVNYIHKEIKDI